MVYQTADPPSPPAQETLWQMNGEIMSMRRKGAQDKRRGEGREEDEQEGIVGELERVGTEIQ